MAIPVAVYLLGALPAVRRAHPHLDPFHLLLIAAHRRRRRGLRGPVRRRRLAQPVTLLVLALAPWVTVVGYEAVGHRHNAEVLAALPEH